MLRQTGPYVLIIVGLVLVGCNNSTVTPTPDSAAFNAAVETAVALTRAAEALIPTATPPASSSAATATSLPTATLSPTPSAQTDQPTPLSSSPTLLCTVVANNLNLHSGPGTVYEPPLVAVATGTELLPLAFMPAGFPGGQWLQVQIKTTGQTGWVNAETQFIACNTELTALPVGIAPPTPSPTFTPAPSTPTPLPPTPTPPLLVSIPPDGGQSDLQGFIVLPGYSPAQVSEPMIFKGSLVIQVAVYDPNFGLYDGAGIANVEFTINRDDGNDNSTLYQHTESTPGYCVFGGGEPICTVLVFAQTNNRWPETNLPIVDGPHRAFIQINRANGDSENWNWGFQIQGALPQTSEITAQIVQTGPNTTANSVSGALVFQVFASTEEEDGAGIDRVDMRIIGPGGEVYQRTEQNAAYCAFSGGEPDCMVWNFAEHNHAWPNGDPIASGEYLLQATVYAQDGSTTTIEQNIDVNLN